MRLSKGLLTALALLILVIAVAASSVAFAPLKSLVLSVPLRFDYVPKGPGDKPLLTTDLDGEYVKSVAHSNHTVTVTLQNDQNAQRTLSVPVGSALIDATYAADTETLTLTLSEGDPVTADLSGVTTTAELATAIRTAARAINAATIEQIATAIDEIEFPGADGVLTGATYTANDETLTLTLSEGGPVTADLSGLTTATEVATAIHTAVGEINAATTQQVSDALAAETDAVITGATYTANDETLTLTLSEGGPVTADLSGLTTATEVATAIRTAVGEINAATTQQVADALAAETDAVITGATYTANDETLTLTLSEGGPVTADLSGLTTATEVATAITTAIDAARTSILSDAANSADTAITTALAAETDAAITGATYTANDETLTLTLSEGGPVTADLSGLTTTTEVASAITTAVSTVTGSPVLLGSDERNGAACSVFLRRDIIVPSDGWIIALFHVGTNSGQMATQHSIPVSLLHNLPSKVPDSAPLTVPNHRGPTQNAISFTTRRNVAAHLGITTSNRLVVGHSAPSWPCRVSVFAGPAVVADTTSTLTGASYAADTETLTFTLSEGGPVNADLSALATADELSTAVSALDVQVTRLVERLAIGASCSLWRDARYSIPAGELLLVTGYVVQSDQNYHFVSSIIPSSTLLTLPASVPNQVQQGTSLVGTPTGQNHITLSAGSNRGLNLGRTNSGNLAWRVTHPATRCGVELYALGVN